jgi:hypothetical protein
MKHLIPQRLFEMSKVSSEEYRDIIYNFYKYCDDNFYDDIDKMDPSMDPEVKFINNRGFSMNNAKTLYNHLTDEIFADVSIFFSVFYFYRKKNNKTLLHATSEMIIRNSMFYLDEDQNKTSIHRLKDVKKYYDIMFNNIKNQFT